MSSSLEEFLPEIDRRQLEELVGQESHTWDGQAFKMEIIHRHIDQRLELRRNAFRDQLLKAGANMHDAQQEAVRKTKDITFQKITLPNGRKQLIVGRGDQQQNCRKQRAPLNVYVPAHIDTVQADHPGQLTVRPHPKNTDILLGRGVYDMHAGVLNNTALSVDIMPPKGMNIFFGFIFDEEEHSKGAKAVIDSWQWWRSIDVVLSNEIGHIDVPEGDTDMRYILGRRGRLKFQLSLDVDREAQGHFAESHISSSSDPLIEGLGAIRDIFYHGNPQFHRNKKMMKSHPKLGDETLQLAKIHAENPDNRSSSIPVGGEAFFNLLSVPDRSIDGTLRELQEHFAAIAHASSWKKHRVNHTLSLNPLETSYEPFMMPEDHPVSRIVASTLTKLSGSKPHAVYAPSVADENLYASSLRKRSARNNFLLYQGVVSIPPVGNGAHRADEWVRGSSIMRTRKALQMLIEDPEGLIKLRDIKRSH